MYNTSHSNTNTLRLYTKVLYVTSLVLPYVMFPTVGRTSEKIKTGTPGIGTHLLLLATSHAVRAIMSGSDGDMSLT